MEHLKNPGADGFKPNTPPPNSPKPKTALYLGRRLVEFWKKGKIKTNIQYEVVLRKAMGGGVS